MCLGDFNDLLESSEKRGNREHPNWKLRGFQDAVANSELVDLGMEGYQFTWERFRGTTNWLEERLDRAFATANWFRLFPKARVTCLEASCSDHLLILLEPVPLVPTSRFKQFRFENMWLREPDCEEIVKDSWNDRGGCSIQDKISACGNELRRWGDHLPVTLKVAFLSAKRE